jgi:hypothetical protein
MSSSSGLIYPFQAPAAELEARIEDFVTVTVASLSSFYLELPRGDKFLEYEPFRAAFDELRIATADFKSLDNSVVWEAVKKNALVLVILRCILGLSPPELADLALEATGVQIEQGFARGEDAKARSGENSISRATGDRQKRLKALVDAACTAIAKGPSNPTPQLIHRLVKVDTIEGLASVQRSARQGVPYPALLYERLLGRPFATHRDSVSGLVGDIVEQAVIDVLTTAGVPFYKTGHAEAIPGFDQAPDFLIPNAEEPKAVIEAKLTQDDGTARDKVTRVQHLHGLSDSGAKFEVIACIDGRGFKVRPENMRKLLRATAGKVFSVSTMGHLVEQTSLKAFATKV